MHKELFNALKVEKKVMFLILSLIVFVAAFNLISSIIMIVKDKERGIGVLRSLGFTESGFKNIYFYWINSRNNGHIYRYDTGYFNYS